METVDSLKEKFKLADDKQLGELFGRGKSAVSVWRRDGIPAAIERRASELLAGRGIVAEPQTHYSDDPEFDKMIDLGVERMKKMTKKELLLFIAGLMEE